MNAGTNRTMRTIARRGAVVAAFATLGVFAARGVAPRDTTDTVSREERVKRGAYLVTIGGCNDCHTPWKMGEHGPEQDMTRMLSGHPESFPMPAAPKLGEGPWMGSFGATNTAWAGPWGVSFTANLTPDETTGIGSWSEDIFIATLRTGKHWGQSRPILPPMPWFNYGKMSDEDLKSVFAYLRSIPPVHNQVPAPIPPGGPDPNADPVWN